MMSKGTVILFLWLIIGAAAAGQRGYFSTTNLDCTSGATMALTIVAARSGRRSLVRTVWVSRSPYGITPRWERLQADSCGSSCGPLRVVNTLDADHSGTSCDGMPEGEPDHDR